MINQSMISASGIVVGRKITMNLDLNLNLGATALLYLPMLEHLTTVTNEPNPKSLSMLALQQVGMKYTYYHSCRTLHRVRKEKGV